MNMPMSFGRRIIACSIALSGVAAAGEALAATYQFELIAEPPTSSNTISQLSVNDDGSVLVGWFNEGYGIVDLYPSDGPSRRVTYGGDTGTEPYWIVASPNLNNSDQVAYLAVPHAGGVAHVIRDTDGTPTTLHSITIPDQLHTAALSDSGGAAFKVTSTSSSTILCADGTTTTTIAQTGVDGFTSIGDPQINASGQVLFAGTRNGVNGYYLGDGTANTLWVERSAQMSNLSALPSFNDAGDVLFISSLTGGGQGLFLRDADGGTTAATMIADTSSTFRSFGGWSSINDLGDIAFLAGLESGGGGIYTGTDPVTGKVVEIGDPLFGSTVQTLMLYSNSSLNDAGQIAFYFLLADGTRGVALASPVPEPAGATTLLVAGVMALRRRRRRA